MSLLAGRYELLRPLAEGGMAELWLAKLVGTGGFAKLVAVKRILPHLARSARFADMFLDEGRIAADLRHPNIVGVFEAGATSDDDGAPTLFIAMELLEGLDAGQLLTRALARGERLPLGCALQIALDGAEGLSYAHEKTSLDGEPLEIVHRDVSPQNLFVTVDGHTKVVDFGIAKARSQTTMTEAGTLKGKCAYMAPEQVCGDPVDHRADQFALGVVLWELIVGQRLFRKDSDIDTLRAVLLNDVARPSDLVAGVPRAVDDIVMRALATEPAQRFTSCEELAQAIDDALFGEKLRAGARALAHVVSARMKDRAPDRKEVAERTLPERVLISHSGISEEPTSAEHMVSFAVHRAPAPALDPSGPVIGREREKAAIKRALDERAGVVTLVGPMGAGKSHLARVVADELNAAGGTYVVGLEGAESEVDVVTLFAFALGLPSEMLPPDAERAASIAARALSARGDCLVVLDGIDDITAAAAPLARTLASPAAQGSSGSSKAPRVLATARAPLGVMNERVVDVGPLAVPDDGASPQAILASPAVRLLLEAADGARRLSSSASSKNDDVDELARVARGTGGLPASLLLAGRWLAERRPRPIAAEIERRTGEASLAALLDASMHDLNDDDRSALARIAVHRGPLDRSLVDVLVPERDPDEVLRTLRARGAVVGDELVAAARDRALDELAGRGGLGDARATHAAAIAARAWRSLTALDGRDGAAATAGLADLERLRPAVEDAASALTAQSSTDADHNSLLVLALALDAFAARRGASSAHLRLLDAALDRSSPGVDKKLRARALEARADHGKLAGRVGDARRDYLLALDLIDDEPFATALLERNIADLDLDDGDLHNAELHARRAVAAGRRAGSPRLMARATWTLGRIALKRGVVGEAEILLERAAAAFHEHNDARFAARATFELGRCAEARGDPHGARLLFHHALAVHESTGDIAFAERARIHLGVVAAWLGEAREAKALLEAARTSARARGDTRAEAAVLAHLADLDAASGDSDGARARRGEADALRRMSDGRSS